MNSLLDQDYLKQLEEEQARIEMLINQSEQNITKIVELRNATLGGTLNGSELIEASRAYAYLSIQNDEGIVDWFENLGTIPLIGICLIAGLMVMLCICLAIYLARYRISTRLKAQAKQPEEAKDEVSREPAV